MYNIGYKKNAEILKRCKILQEYSRFVDIIRDLIEKNRTLEEAMPIAIERCKEEHILEDFLQKNGTEVMQMLFREISMEEYGDIRAEEGFEDGVTKGKTEGIEKLARTLKKMGLPNGLILQELKENYPKHEELVLSVFETLSNEATNTDGMQFHSLI